MDTARIIHRIKKCMWALEFFLSDERKTPVERVGAILCYYGKALVANVAAVPLAIVILPPYLLLPKPQKNAFQNWVVRSLNNRDLIKLRRTLAREELKLVHLMANPHHDHNAAIRQQLRADDARRAMEIYAPIYAEASTSEGLQD